MSPETVVFTSRRIARMQRVQGARHVVIGLMLALSGLEAFQSGHHATWIDAVAIVSGALLVGAFVVEMRRSRSHAGHPHHGIGWVDVFAAAVTAVEAAHLFHKGKKALPFVYLLLAVILLALGLMHGRLQQLRRLIADDDGFDIRLAPWRRIRKRWDDIADIVVSGAMVTVTDRQGRDTVIDLSDVPQADAVIATLTRRADAALAPPPPAPVVTGEVDGDADAAIEGPPPAAT